MNSKKIDEVRIINEMIHCFRNWIIDNNKRKEVLNQTIKETNIGNQTVPHTNSFKEAKQ